MKAARLHEYHQALQVEQIDEPKILGPLDVIVKIGAAGLCRTDLHIQEGQWAEKSGVELPYTPGHENAGWVHEIGSAVTNVAVGDTVIVHPFISCGLCKKPLAKMFSMFSETLFFWANGISDFTAAVARSKATSCGTGGSSGIQGA